MCWCEADEQIMVKNLLILSIKEITYMEKIRRWLFYLLYKFYSNIAILKFHHPLLGFLVPGDKVHSVLATWPHFLEKTFNLTSKNKNFWIVRIITPVLANLVLASVSPHKQLQLTTKQMLVVVGVWWSIFCFVWGLLFYFLLLIEEQNPKQRRNGLSPSENIFLREASISKGQVIGGTVLRWGRRKSVVIKNVAKMMMGSMGIERREVSLMKFLCWEGPGVGKAPVETGAGCGTWWQDWCLWGWWQQGSWDGRRANENKSNNGKPRWELWWLWLLVL